MRRAARHADHGDNERRAQKIQLTRRSYDGKLLRARVRRPRGVGDECGGRAENW